MGGALAPSPYAFMTNTGVYLTLPYRVQFSDFDKKCNCSVRQGAVKNPMSALMSS